MPYNGRGEWVSVDAIMGFACKDSVVRKCKNHNPVNDGLCPHCGDGSK